MKNQRIVLFAALLLGGSLGGTLAFAWHGRAQKVREERILLEQRRAAWETLKAEISREIRQFHGEAGVWIEDLNTGWNTGYQIRKSFPAASIVKIPILAACYQAAQEGRLRLDEKIVLQGSEKVLGSGRLKAEPNGSVWTVQQLLELMITRSDNTATNLLIRRLGFGELNRSFQKMGLNQTRLSRRMMDFSERKKGVENYTTARDISLTLKKLYQHRLVNWQVSDQCLGLLKRVTLKDRIPALLPKGTVVAHKTGLEKGVCHDSGIVFTPEGDYLVCVLTRSRNKTAQPAKQFIARIAAYAHRYKTEML